MKILKLKLFQETACYKKPFAFKVAETYPLPPYSTVIGMLHKVLNAKNGEYFDMDVSVQGEYESIFSNYQNLRMYKSDGQVTAMPRNVHQLLNINLIIHVQAEDEIIDKLYKNLLEGKATITLGRNEDLVRIDEIKIIQEPIEVFRVLANHSAYVPNRNVPGIKYRLNTVYTIENELRKWNKVDVTYIEKDTNVQLRKALQDEDGDFVYFYK
ncbi:MAG: type I-B CRISPR-associated protein Cas5b [Clostridia bacterium]